MKITARQYAQALHEMTKGKTHKEIDEAVLKFSEELRKKGKMSLFGKIVESFTGIYNREHGIVDANVLSATELNKDQVEDILNFVKKRYAAEKIVLNQKIDETIKGGLILKVGDDVIDGSVAGRLEELRKRLVR